MTEFKVPNDYDNKKYKQLTSKKEILEEIKNVLIQEKTQRSDCVSLYDILNLIKKINFNFDEMNKKYHHLIIDAIEKSNLEYSSLFVGPDFDYEKEEMYLSLSKYKFWRDVYFAKRAGDLYITRANVPDAKEIFYLLSDVLPDCYDDFMKYKPFYSEYKSSLRPVNSNFFVSIHNYRLSLYSSELQISSDFVLYNETNDNCYKCDCNSSELMNEVKNCEDELFKKIYIKIDDCPEWSREILYSFRQKQLEENKRKEIKKQKVLKIFPFLKK